LFRHLSFDLKDDPVRKMTGRIEVVDGQAAMGNFTVIHNRSVAEDVRYFVDEEPYTGSLEVKDGNLVDSSVTVTGKSLIHSVDLTSMAFTRGAFGEWGQYIVSVGLALFAFSTAVAWSYYGDRAITYLFGVKSIIPYRTTYVIGFFVASIVDTSLIWLISAITLACMALPNLFSILILHREMKDTIDKYWQDFDRDHPKGV